MLIIPLGIATKILSSVARKSIENHGGSAVQWWLNFPTDMIMVLTPLELSSDFNDFCLLDPHLLGTLAAAHKNTSHQKIQFKISAVKKKRSNLQNVLQHDHGHV
jgi:hypothetical protein